MTYDPEPMLMCAECAQPVTLGTCPTGHRVLPTPPLDPDEERSPSGLWTCNLFDGTCMSGGLRETITIFAENRGAAMRRAKDHWNVGPGSWDGVDVHPLRILS